MRIKVTTASRRDFIVATTAAIGTSGFANLGFPNLAWADDETPNAAEIKAYLQPLLLTRERVKAWLANVAYPFCKFDGELGYLHLDRDFKEGVDGAICRYRYDKLDARRMIAHADKPCRINTYGNSFTSCEQVSDGETWQEVLAAHLGEPVRNYGIGGYSVYQAYLRMLREENRAPGQNIIFNIFDDDHERNLHGWQRFKFGVNDKSTNPTVPHVKVDPERGTFVERSNPCPTPESVYRLCDLDAAYDMFKDDFVLHNRLRRVAARKANKPVPPTDYDDKELMHCGIYATQQIVDQIEKYRAENDKSVLYVLSYGGYTVQQYLQTGERFDQSLVDFLDRREVPYVDLTRAHAEDFAQFKVDVNAYLSRYYIGHYAPLGNSFCAFAVKDELVRMLEPKPPAYAER
ncbi:MAG: twin-arginine translocation signal domain-containing protein [Planctomycetota bacterium]|nr:twin-arginine translocation signal domain-containing protein [Planctomycetota bacterium]